MIIRNIYILILSLVVFSCTSVKSQKPSAGIKSIGNSDQEDISQYRIKYEIKTDAPVQNQTTIKTQPSVVPKNDVTKVLGEKLDSIHFYSQNVTSADGYRILVYTGSSSEDAKRNKGNVYDVLPDERIYIEWKSPSFRVKVGDYVDKLEAYSSYASLLRTFPNAIVVPDKVNIIRPNK